MQTEQGIESIEERQLLGGVIAAVANDAMHDRTGFLFDVGAIIVSARSTSSEGKLLLEAVAKQLIVDEIRSVVGVDAQQWKGKPSTHYLDGSEDVDLDPVL